jgi:hypothetical protein
MRLSWKRARALSSAQEDTASVSDVANTTDSEYSEGAGANDGSSTVPIEMARMALYGPEEIGNGSRWRRNA